ncbi:MAG: hypothetical protein QXT72_01360 [Candidatus Micrarchaeia archaeon]
MKIINPKLKIKNVKENITAKISTKLKNVKNVKFKKPYTDNRFILLSILTSAPITSVFLAYFFSFHSPYGTGMISPLSSFLLAGVFFSLLPGMAILYYSRKGKVDVELSERESRTRFYLMAAILQLIAAIIFYTFEHKIMFITSITYAVATILMMLINLKWKISAHASGIAGPVTALYVVYGEIALPLYLLLIPVFALRYKVKAHTIWQLIAGSVLSIIVTYTIFSLMLSA